MNFFLNYFNFIVQLLNRFMEFLTEPGIVALLVAILLFLISLLTNLLQRRYAKARFHRMLTKEDSVVQSLEGINKNLGDLEWTCSVEMHGASSPKEMGKSIGAARARVESTLVDLRNHLQSFRQYRRMEKQRKRLEKPRQGPTRL
jgi:hypothetical protein